MKDATPPAARNYEGAQQPCRLARHMTLFALVVYGVGDMVGAGIYATIGQAAGRLGNAVWLSFTVSMVAALLTGLSYASISSRYPRAAGAAYVTNRAFRRPFLSYLVGLAVCASGMTSMATSSNAFANAFHKLVDPGARQPWLPWAMLVGFLLAITLLNLWGIRESLWGNLVCTAVEIGGLLLVIVLGLRYWGGVNYLEVPAPVGGADTPAGPWRLPTLVMGAAVLTFFSFVGFEDMLNVGEEVKDPTRTMPRGILAALLITTVIYISMSLTAVAVVPYAELSKHPAPLELISREVAPWLPRNTYTVITMFAVANTALINYIMGSRLLYGMSRHGLVPAPLSRVHAGRRTPHVAILVLGGLVLILALCGRIEVGQGPNRVSPVRVLADSTALLLLGCFCVVNAALIVLQRRSGEPKGRFEVPSVVPALGSLVCLALILSRLLTRNAQGHYEWRAPIIAAGVGVFIATMYFVMRPRVVVFEEEEGPVEVESAGAAG
jgi:basic amino acid/polyamine antiporter, APA family